ncbi:MAG: hypothetical protein KatS3mg004_2505 [Bryobacteraceae bacterium]|nr:MAG: hypothetical protein KatS3mg004_2505 [Bryobacteraceae bacterium]
MNRFCYRSVIDAPVERVFAFHQQPDALERLLPAWPPVRVVRRTGGLEPGSLVELELRFGPMRLRWLARHTEYRENEFFSDEQVRGPFRTWRHRHGFGRMVDGRCVLVDEVEFSLPLGPLSDWLAGRAVKHMLRKMFATRHALTAAACGAAVCQESGPAAYARSTDDPAGVRGRRPLEESASGRR